MSANGRLTASELSAIPDGRLEAHAAAAWNTMRLYIWNAYQVAILPAGSRSSYRTYQEQVYFWNLYKSGQGNLAAYPGTSNHGLGKAVDVRTTTMVAKIRAVGHAFKWAKVEAFTEWWHYNYIGGFTRPNPGTSLTYPVMRRGSGGPGQARFVREIQGRLRKRGYNVTRDGQFGRGTKDAVQKFQKKHGMKADGIVGRKTWLALRK